MVYLLGRNLSLQKRVYYALQAFSGVGLATAKRLCDQVCIHPLAKVKDITDSQIIQLKEILQPMMEQQRQNRLLRIKQAKNRPVPLNPT